MKHLKLSTKALTVDDAGIITGIAWPFGTPDSYGDVIAKGAFQLRDHIPMLWDHDAGEPIGIWESIRETGRGLEVRGRLLIDKVERAAEVFALIKSGAVRGLSIGFWPIKATRNVHGGEDISELDLIEISIVSIPAHPDAQIVSAKSAKGRKDRKLTKATAKKTNAKALELEANNDNNVDDDTVEDESVEERVDNIEAELAELKELVTGTSETVADVAKSVRTLVTKAGRPTLKPQVQEKPEDIARKAFISYLRHGDRSPEIKGLTTAKDPNAGYVAPPEFVKEMLRELVEYSPIRQYAKVGSTGNGSVIIPGRTGSANAQWVGEDEEATESDFGFAETEIFIHELATWISVPNNTLADAEIDIEAEIRTAFAEDFGLKEGRAFLFGSGVKQPEGLLTRDDVPFLTAAATAAINPDELIKLLYAQPAPYRNSGVWAMNGTTLGVLRTIKDGQNNYIWRPGLAEGQPETILGRPVVEMVDMPDIAAGSTPIVYGDWSGYRIYDRSTLDVLVDPYSESKRRRTNFLVNRRVGGGVVEPKKFRKFVMKAA